MGSQTVECTNSKDNLFLVQNLQNRLRAFQIDDTQYRINASSPVTGDLPEELRKDFDNINLNIYKGNIVSFFNLLEKNKKDFDSKVDAMEISNEDKQQFKNISEFS